MSDTPKTDAMMEAIEVDEIKLIAGGNQATFSSDAMESITELARDFERENEELRKQLEQAEAKIDSLMLEYCPDDMTTAQIERWAKNQVVDSTSPASPPADLSKPE